MRKVLLIAACGLLGACEFDTSKEHLAYCANGGLFGCGHGTRMIMQNHARGPIYYPAPAPAAPVPMNCTTTTNGMFTNTNCM